MGYRIGSFNCLNFGLGYNKNPQIFADIIYEEQLDIIALQEVKRKDAVDMILRRLPAYWKGVHDSYGDFRSPNDYAYIWNTRRVNECSKDGMPEIFQHVKADNLIRKPYFGRFSPAGLPGGAFFEIRLIDVHIYYGSSLAEDVGRRIDEYRTLADEVYTRINKKRYGNNMPSYTVMLGDYNLTAEWCERQNIENQQIDTFQREATTLKAKEDGFSNSYDHFSYDSRRFGTITARVERINSVEKYCKNDFGLHRKYVSDHVPIVIEIELK